jgi:hypothetical protein
MVPGSMRRMAPAEVMQEVAHVIRLLVGFGDGKDILGDFLGVPGSVIHDPVCSGEPVPALDGARRTSAMNFVTKTVRL